jgi:hypothetical protein
MNKNNAIGPDIFISYAGEDANLVARPLAAELSNRGCCVWFAEFELCLGDSLRSKINAGLASCKFGVVVLSHAFFAKQWTRYELDGLTAREITEAKKIILPIWHRIDREEVAKYSPVLADRIAVSTNDGLTVVADKVLDVLDLTKSLFLGAQRISSLVNKYVEYWRRDRILLDKTALDLLFEHSETITLSGDIWLMIAESACEKQQIQRWIELVSPQTAWLGLKAILLKSNSPDARKIAGELLAEPLSTEQVDYEETVLCFIDRENDQGVLEKTIPIIAKSKCQGLCVAITRLLLSTTSTDSDSLLCVLIESICNLCPPNLIVQTLDIWLNNQSYPGAGVKKAIQALGYINHPTGIARLKKMLNRGILGGDDAVYEYIQCLATSLKRLGMTQDEIKHIADAFAMYVD